MRSAFRRSGVNGTLELLLTHPFGSKAHRIVWAKFWAGTTLVAALHWSPRSLAGYARPPPDSATLLGNIDDGAAVVAGYLGLLSSSVQPLSPQALLPSSARPDSQVVAFLILGSGSACSCITAPRPWGPMIPYLASGRPRSSNGLRHGDPFPLHRNRGGRQSLTCLWFRRIYLAIASGHRTMRHIQPGRVMNDGFDCIQGPPWTRVEVGAALALVIAIALLATIGHWAWRFDVTEDRRHSL